MAVGSGAAVKDRFTSLDVLAVVRELRALPKARVDKIFDRPHGGFAVALRVAGEGRRELVLVPGRFAAVVAPSEHSEELTPFARELRRLITGARLVGAAEPGGERYLEVELAVGAEGGPLLLGIELFGSGNLVIAQAGRILAVQHARAWAHRTLRVGAPYERPPIRVDPWSLPASGIEAALRASRTDRATTLAARLAMGGPVAEEVLVRAGLDGAVSAPTDAAGAAQRIRSALDALLGAIGERPGGYLLRRGELLLDASPFPTARFGSDPETIEERLSSFSEAADRFFRGLGGLVPSPPSPADQAIAELRRQAERQRSAIASLSAEADRLLSQGESLLERFPEAERLREAAQRLTPEGKAPIEIDLAGETITILPRRSIRASAQALFEAAKERRAKAEGAATALLETERRIAEQAASLPTAPRLGEPARPRAAKAAWFERYRWFVSSEGILVIGGRDAGSNETIVRRYLGERDLYVHAEIQGAASVVVKQAPPGRPSAGEPTLQEAAQWAVAFSKAWRAGLASASAFWVAADQVQKAGRSGEFVARGSFVVRSPKHTLKDLPMELAIGTLVYEGRELWEVAPPRAFEGRGSARFRLAPGEERERASVEIELAEALELSRSRLQSLLPAGGLSIRRT